LRHIEQPETCQNDQNANPSDSENQPEAPPVIRHAGILSASRRARKGKVSLPVPARRGRIRGDWRN
jgi:hypothetical protein